jgi:RNA polymerase sigma-70 factor (ECF subfamily)
VLEKGWFRLSIAVDGDVFGIVPQGKHAPVWDAGAPSAAGRTLSGARNRAYHRGLSSSMSAPAALGGASAPTAAQLDRAAEYADLVELAHADPEAGLTELHRRFAGTVNRLVWRLLGPDPDHDDLVQQVFFAMLTSIKQLRDSAKLEVWVRTVTVNAVRQELRRRAVRRLFWNEHKHIRRVGDLVEEVESRDLLEQCVDVLEKIPTAQRLVFVLHFVEGHSLKDVADMCGYSHITAKRRLKSANKRFRTLIRHRPDLLKRLERMTLEASEADSD